MDAACARLLAAGRPDGLICSTDADTQPAPDWLAATLTEADGVHAVGGRALLLPDERAALDPETRRWALLELAYRRAVEDLRGLYAPEPWDPTPRHHHHFGASLAVRADAYAAVGGLPARERYEDIALVHALWADGRRVRHSARVKVWTSARTDGRAGGGLAHDLARWSAHAADGTEPRVEPAAQAERRLARLALWCHAHPGCPAPIDLLDTPLGARPTASPSRPPSPTCGGGRPTSADSRRPPDSTTRGASPSLPCPSPPATASRPRPPWRPPTPSLRARAFAAAAAARADAADHARQLPRRRPRRAPPVGAA